MCLIVPARVLRVGVQTADIELPDGTRATVNAALTPDLRVGQYVLVDRGLVLEVIETEEAQAILALYAELAALSDDR